MLQFDIHTREDWKNRNISFISLDFISAGCAGTEIRISENVSKDLYTPISIQDSNVLCYVKKSESSILKESYITGIKGKWILKSDSILTRCGCSKSFSLKTGDNFADKIKLLKSKLSKRPKHTL